MRLMDRKELEGFRKHASNSALWERAGKLVDSINRMQAERGALLTELQKRTHAIPGQLEEVKGKLAITIEDLKNELSIYEEDFNDAPPGCGSRYWLGKRINEIKATLQFFSPDIQRYREEIEREAREKAIQDCVQTALTVPCVWGYATARPCCATTQAVIEAIQSLLPNQKEVSGGNTADSF